MRSVRLYARFLLSFPFLVDLIYRYSDEYKLRRTKIAGVAQNKRASLPPTESVFAIPL